MDNIFDILDNTKVNGDYHTHVSMIKPMGKYQINKNIMERFWERYCSTIYEEEKISLGIAEKLQSFFPVLVDVDIKLPFTEDKDLKRLYTEDQLLTIVREYQQVLLDIVKDCTSNHLICFVLEKNAYKTTSGDNEYIKSGFHLHFPYTFLSKSDHEAHLIPRVKKLIEKTKVFENLGIKNSADLIDNSYTRNPWLLYGSKKSDTMEAYKVTSIYDRYRDKMDLETALKDYKIYDVEENLIDISYNYELYLPRVLSVVPWHRDICETRPNLPSIIRLGNGDKPKREYVIKNLSQTLEKAKKFITIMSEDRAAAYSDWMQVGWALYNISDGSEDGMNLWLEFSSKCQEKFKEAECISVWDRMERRNMTIGTLAHFAKEDNPIEYNKIINAYTEEYIKESVNEAVNHHDIAMALFERFGTEFKCASVDKNIWYQFQNHHWKKMEDGVFLRTKLSNDMVKLFEAKRCEIFGKMSKLPESEKSVLGSQAKQIQKMISCLKSNSFKKSVMSECKDVFYDENFMKILDKDAWLFCFRNGVYDLKNNIFRPGTPEDYISLQAPIDYVEYDEDDKHVKDVYDFLEKIFPDKDVRAYFLDASSDVFIGGNKKKHVYFWSGEGNNGKSITQLFFEKMLGEYSIKLPTSLIVGKRTQSSSASPELVRAGNGVRWAILQEPDKKDVINIGILKELSGNDSFFARGLFQAGGEIEPMFKLAVICNDPPSIPYSDKATWNRIRVIPFETAFCEDAPDTYEEQLKQKRFPIDPFFNEKIPALVKAFAWVLLNHRKKGIKLVEPDKVKCATASYRKKNDTYQQFIEEQIVEDPKARITLADLYNSFKDWFKEGFPNQSMPVKTEVKEYLTKLWGEPERNSWKGRRVSTVMDEVENGTGIMLDDKDMDN